VGKAASAFPTVVFLLRGAESVGFMSEKTVHCRVRLGPHSPDRIYSLLLEEAVSASTVMTVRFPDFDRTTDVESLIGESANVEIWSDSADRASFEGILN